MSSAVELVQSLQLAEQAERDVNTIEIEHILLMKMLVTLNEKSKDVLNDVEELQKQRAKNNKD